MTMIDPHASGAERPAPEPAYPLDRPSAADARFTLGLTLDLAEVLAAHGYPPIRAGADIIALQQALFGFLYGPAGGDR